MRRPVLNIPNLAIHLETSRDKFEFNSELHLRPILAHNGWNIECEEKTAKESEGENDVKDKKENSAPIKGCQPITEEHHDQFLKVL